jgi:DNA-directed RNA polymerase specialized sigma24 family protein
VDQTRDRRDNGREREQRWQGTASAPPQTSPEAFATNFRTLTPALYDFLNRLSGRDETADALMRQVASQAAMSAASADQWPSARAWLFARAYTALPTEASAAAADPAPYIEPDPSMLPPIAPEDGLDDMTRAVWRAISALPVEQHALVHLHTREAMVVGEAASVLGITEREAADRLQRLTPAVEAASRALFLIRYGRPRDPELDALLARLNITRLTPEARASIEEYAERSPTARQMLAAIPPPLTVYAALRPIPPPAGIADEAIAGALPWLPLVEETTTAIDMPTTALPEEPAYAYGAETTTAVTPTADPWAYGQQQPAEENFGTRALDIPVRQRVVQEEAVYVPPRPTNRAMGPLALLGLLGGALVVVVGALVLFLARGDSGPSVSVTATVGGTPTATSVSTALSPALATSTALAALLGTPTPFPTATTAPLPPSTAPAASTTVPTSASTLFVTPTPLGTQAAGSPFATPISTPIDTPVPKVTLAPIITLAPISTPAPRVTPIPTDTAAPTKPPTPATTPTHTPTPTAKPATSAPTETASGPTVTVGAGGAITLDKTSVNLGAGGNSSTIKLSNAGPSAVSFTAKSNIPALTVSPAAGTVPTNGSVPATITINRAGLIPGTYSGTITFTTSSGSFSAVTVTFTV